MPIYTVKEFSQLTGKKPKDIHTYATRGKVVKTSDSRIDSTNAINSLFLELNKSSTTLTTEDQETSKKQAEKTQWKAKKRNVVVEEANRTDKLIKLELEKKQLEVDKLKRLNEIAEEDLKLKRGETIDYNTTIATIKNYNENFKKELASQIQSHIQEICTRHNIASEKTGEYKIKVLELINNSNDNTVDLLKDL